MYVILASHLFLKLPTLRGTVLEETIPTSAKSSSNRAIPPKEVIEYVTQGELQTSSLKVAKYEEKVMYIIILYMYNYNVINKKSVQ